MDEYDGDTIDFSDTTNDVPIEKQGYEDPPKMPVQSFNITAGEIGPDGNVTPNPAANPAGVNKMEFTEEVSYETYIEGDRAATTKVVTEYINWHMVTNDATRPCTEIEKDKGAKAKYMYNCFFTNDKDHTFIQKALSSDIKRDENWLPLYEIVEIIDIHEPPRIEYENLNVTYVSWEKVAEEKVDYIWKELPKKRLINGVWEEYTIKSKVYVIDGKELTKH